MRLTFAVNSLNGILANSQASLFARSHSFGPHLRKCVLLSIFYTNHPILTIINRFIGLELKSAKYILVLQTFAELCVPLQLHPFDCINTQTTQAPFLKLLFHTLRGRIPYNIFTMARTSSCAAPSGTSYYR